MVTNRGGRGLLTAKRKKKKDRELAKTMLRVAFKVKCVGRLVALWLQIATN